jgi:hypothetical protein
MTDDQKTEEKTEEQSGNGDAPSAAERAREKEDAWGKAQETMREMEEGDEPPTDLKEWPDDEAKYITYGGGEGDHGYDEGPEKKLGPSSLERHEDGTITIEGEEVDNPDDYKHDEPVEAATQTTKERREEAEGGDDDEADEKDEDEKDEKDDD